MKRQKENVINENFDFENEPKTKMLTIKIGPNEMQRFINKCNSIEPFGIEYSKLIRRWINNWVERGNAEKDK